MPVVAQALTLSAETDEIGVGMRRATRLGVGAVTCAAAVIGLAACGDRITATRTFTARAVVSFTFATPPAAGAYENLDGPLIDPQGRSVPGTDFHQACFFKGDSNASPSHSCTGFVNTGHNIFAFTGLSPGLTDGTFNSLYATGSTGRVIVESGLVSGNPQGQVVRTMFITVKP
jgi:hypothetical protein